MKFKKIKKDIITYSRMKIENTNNIEELVLVCLKHNNFEFLNYPEWEELFSLEKFLKIEVSYGDFRNLITKVKSFQTMNNVKIFLGMKPFYESFRMLITDVEEFQNSECVKLYLDMKPSPTNQDFKWLLEDNSKLQTDSNYKILEENKKGLDSFYPSNSRLVK